MDSPKLKHEWKDYICVASLIQKVKQHPHLYDFNHKDYKDTRKCIQTWFDIAHELGFPQKKWKMCKERWRTLRDVYVRNRKCYLVGGERARKRQKWKFFDQMNFLHSYINHRAFEAEKDAHDSRILWQDGKQLDTSSDSDSDDTASSDQQGATTSPSTEAPICSNKIKRELSGENEEDERKTKKLHMNKDNNPIKRKTCPSRSKSAAVEEMERLLLQEADPLAITVDGQPFKQEMDWTDEEIDMAERSLVKPPSPTPSTPTISLAPSAPAAPGDDKKTVMFKLKLPGGRTIPAAFITDPKMAFIKKKVGMITPTPLKSVPIKIKTVTGSQIKDSAIQSSRLPSPQSSEPPSPLQVATSILKVESKDCTPRTSMSPTPCTEQVHRTVRINAPQEGIVEDEEELFGKYIAAAMRKLTSRSKSLAKMRIQQILFHLEESDRACAEKRDNKGPIMIEASSDGACSSAIRTDNTG